MWLTGILLVSVMFVFEVVHGIAMMSLVWMVPILVMLIYILITRDWRKEDA
jgi:hypothetical protein